MAPYTWAPVYNVLLSMFFEWGVALHDLEYEKVISGEKTKGEVWAQLKRIGRKVGRQFHKDYLVFPALPALLLPYCWATRRPTGAQLCRMR